MINGKCYWKIFQLKFIEALEWGSQQILVTPYLPTRTRQIISTQPCNTTRGSSPLMVFWALLPYKDRLSRYGILMLKIRRSQDRLIFNTEIPIKDGASL